MKMAVHVSEKFECPDVDTSKVSEYVLCRPSGWKGNGSKYYCL